MDELTKINLHNSETDQSESVSTEEMPGMSPKKNKLVFPLILLVFIGLGIGTGYFVAQKRLVMAGGAGKAGSTAGLTQNPTSTSAVKVGDTFGTNDASTFTDTADGIIQAGGINGTGTHHLERGADKSQWVYLTSSVIDLNMFVGDHVTIWGQTNNVPKVGWLMDVGKLKVVEVNAEPTPTPSADPNAQDN